MTSTINWQRLSAPFTPQQIEWRIQSAGLKNDGTWWVRIAPYISSRTIMDRLDEVVGPGLWSNSYSEWKHGQGQLCTLRINVEGEWVSKTDGAGDTEREGLKGGLTSAFKRAACLWGIGRHLRGEFFADIASERKAGWERSRVKCKRTNREAEIWWRPQPGDVARLTGAADAAAGSMPTEQSQSSDVTTEFWKATRKVGMNREKAIALVNECQGDFAAAIELLNDRHENSRRT